MIAPRSCGNRSDMSASSPSAAGVAPASTNRPATATAAKHDDRERTQSSLWLSEAAATTKTAPPPIP